MPRVTIVNILLTIVTLGIYSAWAKVRTQRYFYGNTLLAGSPFDYLANPLAILKGWAIAIVVLIAYQILTQIFPIVSFLLFILLMIALPWVIVRAMQFRARNTSWRNIRFGFKKSYAEAAKVFILYPILMVLTLGLFLPYYSYAVNRFLVTNSGFGTTAFTSSATAKDYYLIFLKPFLVMLVIMALTLAIAFPRLKGIYDQMKAGMEAAQTMQPENSEDNYAEEDDAQGDDELQNAEADFPADMEDDVQTGDAMQNTSGDVEADQYMDEHAEMMQQAIQDLAAANDNIKDEDPNDGNSDVGSGDVEYDEVYTRYQAEQEQQEPINEDSNASLSPLQKMLAMASVMLIMFLTMLFYLAFIAYIQSRLWNLVYNTTELAGNRFVSSIRARDIIWLYASNIIVIICSIGLMIPWVKIRMARYRASKLVLIAAGNLDNFVQAQQDKISALGEELGDVFDLDIGI